MSPQMIMKLNINFIVPKKQNENKMKKNKFFLLTILIGISISMKAQNVESYLKSNDLCGFIKACNYDEDLAIKKLYNYTMEYYSAITRNKSESVVVKWMNLEPLIQSEMSEKEKQVLRFFHLGQRG